MWRQSGVVCVYADTSVYTWTISRRDCMKLMMAVTSTEKNWVSGVYEIFFALRLLLKFYLTNIYIALPRSSVNITACLCIILWIISIWKEILTGDKIENQHRCFSHIKAVIRRGLQCGGEHTMKLQMCFKMQRDLASSCSRPPKFPKLQVSKILKVGKSWSVSLQPFRWEQPRGHPTNALNYASLPGSHLFPLLQPYRKQT